MIDKSNFVTGASWSPLISKKKFSELTGIPLGVIEGWVATRKISSISIGKHRLVNIAALHKQCLEKEFD